MDDLDNEYADAVDNGDKQLALELAFDYASSKGFSTWAYHGTYSRFKVFNKGDIGFHFAKDINIARNRLADTEDETTPSKKGIVLKVALDIQHPFNFPCDTYGWKAWDLFSAANLKLTGEPFEDPEEIFMSEQRVLARYSWNFLKGIGFSKEEVLNIYSDLDEAKTKDFYDGTGDDNFSKVNSFYTKKVREMALSSKYDAIVYINDYENGAKDDATCYIVFSPSQIKSLEPVVVNNELKPLSTRFDKSSPNIDD